MLVDVSFLVELVPEAPLSARCVVIDVLRASTTILSALECNIPYLLPVASLEQARQRAGELGGACYLGGERNKLRPEGFHFGNSPLEYRQIDQAQPVVYTTTNGTRALWQASSSPEVLVGSLRNAQAVADRLLSSDQPVLLIASGTRGEIAAEDIYAAGAILAEMQTQRRVAIDMTDAARVALLAFQGVVNDLATALLATVSGQGLASLGLEADVRYAAELDASNLAPIYADGRLTVERD
jgi:2-phosphosulfolactate phosphatase